MSSEQPNKSRMCGISQKSARVRIRIPVGSAPVDDEACMVRAGRSAPASAVPRCGLDAAANLNVTEAGTAGAATRGVLPPPSLRPRADSSAGTLLDRTMPDCGGWSRGVD
jgi:hypothetical protein